MKGGEPSSTLSNAFSHETQGVPLSDRFPDVKNTSEGVAVPTTFLDFCVHELDKCADHAIRLVGIQKQDVLEAAYLIKLVRAKLYSMCDALRKFNEYSYGGETYSAGDFTLINFKRNFRRMRLIMESHSPLELNAVDLSKKFLYKLLLSNGWEITQKMSAGFPKQFTAWFGQVMIFFARFNNEELGALQQLPEGEDGDSSVKIKVRRRQPRHHYFTNKMDFLRHRGISDVEEGTQSFGTAGVRNLAEDESPCFVAENCWGSILQEQSMQRSPEGVLKWVNSYSETESSELAKLFRNLFWSYLSIPLDKFETDSVWKLMKEDGLKNLFEILDYNVQYEHFLEQAPLLSRFFKRHKNTELTSNDVWAFGTKYPSSEVAETADSLRLKRFDKHRGHDLTSLTDTSEALSCAIKRHVWIANITSKFPESHYRLVGNYRFSLPLFTEWDYRLETFLSVLIIV